MGTYKGVFKANLAFLKTTSFRGAIQAKTFRMRQYQTQYRKLKVLLTLIGLGLRDFLWYQGLSKEKHMEY